MRWGWLRSTLLSDRCLIVSSRTSTLARHRLPCTQAGNSPVVVGFVQSHKEGKVRSSLVFVFGLLACATGGGDGARTGDDTRTSRVTVGDGFPRIIRVQAGRVRVTHYVDNGRLRATTLKGLDPANRHLEYSWASDGEYEVEVSGRYEHQVSGAVISGGRVESRLTYQVLPDSLPHP